MAPAVVTSDAGDKAAAKGSPPVTRRAKLCKFIQANQFLLGVCMAIGVAAAFPDGRYYVAGHITASWIAVIFIFVLSGLTLKTEELVKARQRTHEVTRTHTHIHTHLHARARARATAACL